LIRVIANTRGWNFWEKRLAGDQRCSTLKAPLFVCFEKEWNSDPLCVANREECCYEERTLWKTSENKSVVRKFMVGSLCKTEEKLRMKKERNVHRSVLLWCEKEGSLSACPHSSYDEEQFVFPSLDC
jgi:hypothetical protein